MRCGRQRTTTRRPWTAAARVLAWCAAAGAPAAASAGAAPRLLDDAALSLDGTNDAATVAATTADPMANPEALSQLSLETLLTLDVTSVSKQRQRIGDAPAAVSVITQDDIRRSGLNSIPELLRLVPGLDVARVNANQWAISSRGFNDLYANKLLVLMDGRTLYNPLYSGVFWQQQDYVLPDLDRVEVIRGPGATLWGSNAVNGVINITSKSAGDTQGWLLEARGGTDEQEGAVRYGGAIDDHTFYRVYGKYQNDADHGFSNGTLGGGGEGDAFDRWYNARAGFRIDRHATDADTFTLQGDVFDLRYEQTLALASFAPPAFRDPTDAPGQSTGGNVLGRWTHVVSATSDLSVQLYYDGFRVDDPQLGYVQHTVDLDLQHRFQVDSRNEVIYGAGVRYQSDHTHGTEFISLDPADRDLWLYSAFVQDDVTIVPERLHAYLGTKFEHNAFTGSEVQPSARLLWTPDERNSVWGAVSRAVRIPSRVEQDGQVLLNRGLAPSPLPGGGTIPFAAPAVGSGRFESEELTAFELGYRVQPTKRFSVDVATFFNDYNGLRGYVQGAPAFQGAAVPPQLLIPLTTANNLDARTYGGEVAATWRVNDAWRLTGSYSLLLADVSGPNTAATAGDIANYRRSAPHNQLQLRSYLNVTRDVELNAAVYYVDNVAEAPAYVRADVGVTWRPRENVEVSVGVQDLLDDRHPEFSTVSINVVRTEPQTAAYAQLVVRF